MLEFVEAELPRDGKSDARVELRRARDSLIRAEAEAMSGLFLSAVEMIRESVGSSKRLHHRDKSRAGEATGKCAEFFHCAGSEEMPREDVEVTWQALNPVRTMLRSRGKRADCTRRRVVE